MESLGKKVSLRDGEKTRITDVARIDIPNDTTIILENNAYGPVNLVEVGGAGTVAWVRWKELSSVARRGNSRY